MLNLATLLDESARSLPGKEAVVSGRERLTFGQLGEMTDRIARGLVAAGIRPGDRIALSCPNLHYFPLAYFGIVKAGAVVVPLNVLFSTPEIAYHLADSEAKGYICFEGSTDLPCGQRGWQAFKETLACENFWLIRNGSKTVSAAGAIDFSRLLNTAAGPLDVVTQADDTVVVFYTSGTTGKPKGAELTHANILLNVLQFARLSEARTDDRHLVVLPLSDCFGQTVQMCGSLYNGSTMILLPRFDPADVVEAMLAERITAMCGVPTMYWSLLHETEIERSRIERIREHLRLCVCGGAALPLDTSRDFEARFQVPLLEGYGLSETSPVASFNRLGSPRKPGSVGLPIWGVSLRVVDSQGTEVARGEKGEVVIRGHNVMKGYLYHPEATAEAIRRGWFHSGDIGVMDEEGYLFIVDRVKDMIIRGGYNVYPRELEETFMLHPAVLLAAVVGVPSEQYGEEVKAFIILHDGATTTEDELRAWCRDRMASYKVPRLIEIRKSLPMTATGKILKRKLKAGE